ncbi:putative LOC100569746 [Trichonephila clavipes]|nr:putative LOC100569746 [Trichonephila clavipes]
MFKDSVAASLDIFPHTTKQQHVDFRWLDHIDEVDIHQLGVRITIHVHSTLSMSEMKKPHVPTLRAHELWFQQDGATCHTARATIDLLKDTLGDRLISRFGPVNWPPRSCDLTPLDYFLWGYVKSLVYADKPQTLDHLEDNIRRVIADIRPQMLGKVIENWTSDWITSEPAVAVLCQK